jgi:hypothetical protein
MQIHNKEKIFINNINEIIITNKNMNDNDDLLENIYTYKDVIFLSKVKNNSKNLIVFFHGSIPKIETSTIIFRGYNYNIFNSDSLCISDGLINKYKDLKIGWYLSTVKYPFENVYREIFEHFINSNKYQRVIFTGTSGGGFPSVYWASYFGKIALVSNAHFYIDNYLQNIIQKLGLNNYNQILSKYFDELIYEDKMIEKIILTNKPEKIIIFNNINDKHYSDAEDFINFIYLSNLNNLIEINIFKDSIPTFGKTHHRVNFPNDLTYNKVIENYIIK